MKLEGMTPKQQLLWDRINQQNAGVQYREGMSVEEWHRHCEQLNQENIERNAPVGQYARALLDGVDYVETLLPGNHWDYVAKSFGLKKKK